MRHIYNTISVLPFAAMLLLSSGCGKHTPDAPVTGFPEDGIVRVSAGLAATKADGDGQYLGPDLGLFIDYGSGDRYTTANVRWNRESSVWTAETQMLWKDAKTAAALYAYAPFVDGASDPAAVKFAVPKDQSSGTTDADLLCWTSSSFVPNDSNAEFVDGKVQIGFSHSLVKLTLNFEKASQFPADVTVKKAVLKGTSAKVSLDLKSGTVDAESSTTADIEMYKAGELRYEAVFWPGAGQKAGAEMLEVTMSDGTRLFYTVPSSGLVAGGLTGGSAYLMKMQLGKDKIEVIGNIMVSEWADGIPFGDADAAKDGNVWDGSIAASFESGSGTEADPYIIATSAQLAYLAQSVNGGTEYEGEYFRLTSNLFLDGKSWTPIGVYEHTFKGHFDGNHLGIYELNVSVGEDAYAGLFGIVCEGGGIKNLDVKAARVVSTGELVSAAILCGYVYGSTVIEGCSVHGSVEGFQCVGGIVGEFYNSEMKGCLSEVTVKGALEVGGICGRVSDGKLSDCSAVNCLVEGTSWHAGGLVGSLQFATVGKGLFNCTVDGVVKGVNYVGGLAGWIPSGGSHELSGCSAYADLTVQENGCGGFVGCIEGEAKFSDCGFDGNITSVSGASNVGVVIGIDKSSATFTDCWYNQDKGMSLPLAGEHNRTAEDYSGIEPKNLGE